MSDLTAAEVETGTGGNLEHGSRETVFSNVSIDTRNLKGGDIFFAIRGPNQDGHRFIPDALSRGAVGAVVESGYRYPGVFPPDRVLITVGDTHESLKKLANWRRIDWPGTLVAITGSMGKTTTREFAAHVTESKLRVYRTPGNYNNLFGLPLALFGLSDEYDLGIFEMGMSAAGEIAEMCRIAAPEIGIITNVAPVHLEFFDSIEDIARAKGELAAGLPAGGTLIYNADDPLVKKIAKDFQGRTVSFGCTEPADIRAAGVEIKGMNETRFELTCSGVVRRVSIPLAGPHYVMNVLPAIALGNLLEIPIDRMIGTFATLRQASMRGQILHFRKGFTVIDDSYNSNPRALMRMTEVLSGMPAFNRRILIAGEMLELGNSSNALHFECGKYAAEKRVDLVIGVRGAAQEIVRAAAESGTPDTHFFRDSEEAAEYCAREIRNGDLVLIKGSRGVHLERIIQRLRTEFEVMSD